MRAITLPPVGAAFQPAVAKPWVSGAALRLVEHDQQQIARLVGRQDRHESGEQLGLGIAAVDHLFRRAGLAADIVARHVGLAWPVPFSTLSRIR